MVRLQPLPSTSSKHARTCAGFLLGSGGPGGDGGALARFVSSAADRKALVEAVAKECQRAAQLPEAVELFMHADQPEPALHLINQLVRQSLCLHDVCLPSLMLCMLLQSMDTQSMRLTARLQLADSVEAAVAGGPGSVAMDNYEALVRRGNAAAEVLATRGGEGARQEVATLAEVRAVHGMAVAEARGNYTEALRRSQELSFLPHERFRLQVRGAAAFTPACPWSSQVCVQAASALHPALSKLLPYTLLVAARALSAAHQSQQLQLLASYAGALPQRINTGVLQQIVRLQAH